MCVPRALGQLLILLQYQTLAQRIKVMVRKAENLAKLTRIPGAPGKNQKILTPKQLSRLFLPFMQTIMRALSYIVHICVSKFLL